jgi:hypothetical protein
MANEEWVKTKNGVYPTGKDFYKKSGGILASIPHYEQMFDH